MNQGHVGPGQQGGTSALAGFVWQAYKALEFLFSKDVAEVILEGAEDVVVCHASGIAITAVQAKHHEGEGSLTAGAADLWKTLRNWLVLEGDVATRPAAYELLTTQGLNLDLAILGVAAEDRSQPEMDRLIQKLDELASKPEVKDAGVKEGRSLWSGLGPAAKRQFLVKSRIHSELEGVDKQAQQLADKLTEQFALTSNAEFIAEGLQAWFLGYSLPKAAVKASPTPLTRELAYAKFLELHASCLKEMPDAQYGNFSEFPPQPHEAMFIKQLRAIDALAGELTHAHQMFVKARLERDYLAKHDRGLGWIREFRSNLKNIWGGHHASAPAYGGTEIDQGKEVLNRCRNASSDIGTRRARVHEVEGNFHDLSNEGALGWHPKWKGVK